VYAALPVASTNTYCTSYRVTAAHRRAEDAKALVELSRSFDTEGLKQKLLFIAPIIMDSITSKALPRVFKPNTIAYLQQEGVSFTQVNKHSCMLLIIYVLLAIAIVVSLLLEWCF
jgi:hypothetical protein